MTKDKFAYDKELQERVRRITRSNEPESNIIVAKTLLVFAALCIMTVFIFKTGFLKSKSYLITVYLIVSPVLFVVSAVWCIIRNGEGAWFKYLFFVLLSVFWIGLDVMSSYRSKMFLPVLILLSLRYYNRILTIFTYIASLGALLLSVWCNAFMYNQVGLIDLNTVYIYGISNISFSGDIIDEIIDLQPASIQIFKHGLQLVFFSDFVFLSIILFVAMRFMRHNLYNILKADELASKDAKYQLELADMKTKIMLSQIKPHFVYNTLSSIAALCDIEPQKAKSLTLDFSTYLRNNLDSLNNDKLSTCSFETELNHIKSYLNIELIRFEDELKVEYDIADILFFVPILSIQPLVENAVKHGVTKKVGGGTVRIASRAVDRGHEIIISDDGAGFVPGVIPDDGREHFGLSNIENRISLYGGNVDIYSSPGIGTTVKVFIPEEEGISE